MIGRQVIVTNRKFTLQELYDFMKEHWNEEEYGEFILGRPSAASIEEYIMLPATDRFLVIVFPRAAGGLFHKENKVILTTANNEAGVVERLQYGGRHRDIISEVQGIKSTMSMEKERKGPAEEVLQYYTAHMRDLLQQAGCVK